MSMLSMLRNSAELILTTLGVVLAVLFQHQFRGLASPEEFLVGGYGVPAAVGFLLGLRGFVCVLIGSATAVLLVWDTSYLPFVVPAATEAAIAAYFGRSLRTSITTPTAEVYARLLILCGVASVARTAVSMPLLGWTGNIAWDDSFSCFFPALMADTTLLPLAYVLTRQLAMRRRSMRNEMEFAVYVVVGCAAMWVLGDSKLRQTITQVVPVIGMIAAMLLLTVIRFEVRGVAAFLFLCHLVFGLMLLYDPPMQMPNDSSLVVVCGVFSAVNIATILLAATVAERRKAWREMQRLLVEVERQRDELQRLAGEGARKQAFLETALDQLPAGFLIVDADDRITHMNAVSREWFRGLRIELGKPLHVDADWKNHLPDGRIEPFTDCAIHRASRRGETTRDHEMIVVPDRFPELKKELTVSAAPVRGAGGSIIGSVVLMQDLTEQKRTARRLQQSEQQLRLVLKLTRLKLWEHDYETQVTVSSEPIGVWHGLPSELNVLSHQQLMAYVHPDDVKRISAISGRIQSGLDQSFELTYRVQLPDAGTRLFLTRGHVVREDPPKAGIRTHGVVIDISKQRADEQRLRMLESAVIHARDAVIVLEASPSDALGRKVLYVNRAFTEMSGYEANEIVGRSLHVLRGPESDPATLDQLRTALETVTPLQTELMNYTKDGRKFWVELSLVPVPDEEGGQASWVMIQRDISERKQSLETLRIRDEQLYQSQKMETVGQLAGGVAHDFNNLLTAVIGNLCLVDLPQGDPNRELLAVAEQAAQRAADLTKKLLGFARRNQILVRPIPVRDFVHEVVGLLRRTIDPRIEIHADIPDGLNCLADTTLLNQVLLNLCLNSRDAMTYGGSLSITATEEHIEDFDGATHADLRPGRFVKISVSDTGHGMAAETVARLYEPFFTTKPPGQGTGLGLAMVHGIIRQHKGWIVCRSQEKCGTTFEFGIPSADGNLSIPKSGLFSRTQQELLQHSAASIARKTQRSELILLVDDEEMIRDIAKAVLEGAGFRVVEACDGIEAVQRYRTHREEIRLVVLDMIMPKLSGRDAAEQIIAVNPQARILLSSGYTTDDIAEVAGVHAVLSKPYRPNELLAAVLDALAHENRPDGSPPSPSFYNASTAGVPSGTR